MIKSMWGLCDGVEIIFTESDEAGTWICDVPADLSDGMYVVEIWLETNTGSIAYTNAILYLCDASVVSLEFVDDKLTTSLLSDNIKVDVIDDLMVQKLMIH